jgi:hypothetical protein
MTYKYKKEERWGATVTYLKNNSRLNSIGISLKYFIASEKLQHGMEV